jgi:hypothetical protein
LDANYAASLPSGSLATAINPALRTAYVNQWNASLQQMLARSDSLEVSYLGSSGHRLLTLGDPDHVRSNGLLWFDPSCFAVPPTGYFGSGGRTVLNGPGLNNWDLGLQKFIPLALESGRLVFPH